MVFGHEFEYFALFSLLAHLVPKCQSAPLVEWPHYGLSHADALLGAVEVYVGVKVLVCGTLLLENGLSVASITL
jgi:hypothetical protein